jgi:hypothetical protein
MRKIPIILSLFLTLMVALRTHAAESIPSRSVSSATWSKLMKTALPESLCESKGYYLTCYDLNAKRCQSLTSQQVVQCLGDLQLPNQIEPEGNGVRLSLALGQCVAQRAKQGWQKWYRDSDACQTRDIWF